MNETIFQEILETLKTEIKNISFGDISFTLKIHESEIKTLSFEVTKKTLHTIPAQKK